MTSVIAVTKSRLNTALLLLVSALLLSSANCHVDEPLMDEIVVQLGFEDLNSIKSAQLCSELDGSDCWLSFLPDAVRDAVGIYIEGTADGQCYRVDEFITDETSPELSQFVELDLDSGVLTLNFTEVIRTTTANFSSVTLQSTFFTSGESYILTQGDVLDPLFSTNVTLQLNLNDLNEIKRNELLCTSASNCWIWFSQTFIVDVAGNYIQALVNGDPDFFRRALQVVPDDTAPNIIAFDVNLDTEQVTFFFDETVTRGTFDVTSVIFTASENVSTNYTLTNARVLSTDPAVVSFTIELDETDVINLKAIDNLFTGEDDTFLVHDTRLIDDVSGIDIDQRIAGIDALQVRNFTQDATPPILLLFPLLNMDQDLMQLFFNEPVNISAINFTQIILRSRPLTDNSSVAIPLTGAADVVYETSDKRTITIFFNLEDIRTIKLEPTIATEPSNSYVVLEEGAIEDAAGNPSSPTLFALNVDVHVRDTRGPELLSFNLNLTSDTLSFTFNDVVNVGSLQVSMITLQPDQDGVSSSTYTLTDSTSSSVNGFIFVIDLSITDSNGIKAVPDLATNENNTYISFTAGVLLDIFGANVISVIPTDATRVSDFYPDTIPPVLVEYGLNYNEETLSLTFNETIDLDSLDVSLILLHSEASNALRSYQLTGGVIQSERYVTSFSVNLTRQDLNMIKFYTDLAVGPSTTYLSLPTATITDANGNAVVEIPRDTARMVTPTLFVPDSTPPLLLSFDLDMNIGQITITFDETVNTAVFMPNLIQIQASDVIMSSMSYYQLTGGERSQTNSPIVTVNISTPDLNAIKRNIEIATSMNDTYISLSPTSVQDMNRVAYINVSFPRVTIFTMDETDPELVAFTLNVNLGQLILTFSETVDSTSLQIPTITFLASTNVSSADEYHILMAGFPPNGSITFSPNSTEIVITLGRFDLDEIKRLAFVGTEENNTYISITNTTILDMNGNLVVPIGQDMALPASLVEEDITSPELVFFSLDLNNGFLRLTFSETVNASTLEISAITLLSTRDMVDCEEYTLMDSISQTENAVSLDVRLGAMDLNLIKFRSSLAVDFESTFLRLDDSGVSDMNGNTYMNGSTVLQVTPGTLIPDQMQPSIQAFSLDIDSGILFLTFSEVINASTLDVTAINIQNDRTAPSSNFTLTGGDLSGMNIFPGHPPIVEVILTFDDLNSIKRLSLLAVDNETTYLSILPNAALDRAPVPNPLQGISATLARGVETFIEDTTSPQLVYFDVDLTNETLLIVFNETMNRGTFNVSQFVLHSGENLRTSMENYTLQTSFIISDQDDTEVLLRLETTDLNSIKLLTSLCTSELDCYLSFSEEAISDMNDNPVVEIPSSSGESVRNFTEDQTKPQLIDFGLNMNDGILYLTFSEPVLVSTLNITAIVLGSYLNANTTDTMQQLTPGMFPEFTDSPSNNGVVLMLRIGYTDLYEIQRKRFLATDSNNTYLSLSFGAVLDMNRLEVEVVDSQLVNPAEFVEDTTPPSLLEFILDVNAGQLTLMFDETVDSTSIRPDAFTFLASNDTMNPPQLTLSFQSSIQSFDDFVIVINLTKADLDELKLFENLGIVIDDTYLHLMSGAVSDNARFVGANQIEPVVIQASDVVDDDTRPMLDAFEIDLNTGLLVLYFDEPVNGSSTNFGAITFQNAEELENVTSSFTLTDGTVLSINGTLNGLAITVNLTVDDLNSIKVRDNLLVSLNSSFIVVREELVNDMAGNMLSPPEGSLQAEDITLDTISPTLFLFQLDMNSGIILLEFNEPVNISTVNFTDITLQQGPSITMDRPAYTLQGGVLLSMNNDELVRFKILPDDLNELKRLQIGSSPATSFISFTENLLIDIADNRVVPVSGRPVTGHTPDSTPPVILDFGLDLTNETLELFFSETVRARSLDVTGITLQDEFATVNYTLTGVSFSNSVDGTSIVIRLGRDDLNIIKLETGLATASDNTFISYTSATIFDVLNNAVENRSVNLALQVRNFTGDFISPELEGFSLDLTNETLTLSFSETVNASSLNPSAITIQNDVMLTSSYVTLTEGVARENGFILEVELQTLDLNELKRLLNLATEVSNTFISVTPDLVRDMNDNAVVARTNNSAIMANNVIGDNVAPFLQGFVLNLNTSELTLNFSETVLASSLIIQAIILQDDFNSTNPYQLMDGTVQVENSPIIVVEISKTDTDLIKEMFTLATEVDNTFLRLNDEAIQDMNMNPIEMIQNGLALMADNFIPDEIRPELLNFTLDLNLGQLLLLFSETVNVESVNFTAITLLNETNGADVSVYALTDGAVSMRNYTDVVVTLVPDDLNTIKSILTLGTSVQNTHLSITVDLIQDMNDNSVIPIANANATQAYDVIPDVTPPSLISFNLNLTTDVLFLSFNETVSAISFEQSALTFHDSQDGIISYTLVDSYVTPIVDATEIFVQLSTRDVNEIKRLSLATSEENTYISIEPRVITDTSGNQVVGIAQSEALNVTEFFEDELNPVLLSFDFNLSSGEITVTFSETVNASSLDVRGFSLQNTLNITNSSFNGFYQLTSVSTSSQDNRFILVIQVFGDDLNLIKRDTTLAITNVTTFLSGEFGSVLDMNGNPLESISETSALQVTEFTQDTVPPELEGFNLLLMPGLNDLVLELIFSETVNASSVIPTRFTFSNSENTTSTTQTFTLTSGVVSTLDSTIVTVQISETDLESIRQLDNTMLLTLSETSFITVAMESVYDMAGNAIVPITLSDGALNINGRFADLNPPDLVSYIFDLNMGIVLLQFDEPVIASSFIPTRLTLHSGPDVGFNNTLGSFFTLTNATMIDLNFTAANTPLGSVLMFQIVDEDLNEIKRLTELATSRAGTYLSIERGVVLDLSLNEAVFIAEDNAQRAMNYVQDRTGPQLESFDFDLTVETITLTFSETINASSVDVTQFTFQNSISSSNRFYTLSNSVVTTNDSTVLVIALSEDDSNRVKAIDGLLTSDADSFLTVDREALRDLAGNELVDIFPSFALNVMNYTVDTIRPVILNFTIDLNQGMIALTFDETVRESTLDVKQLNLLDASNQSVYNLTLTSGFSDMGISHIVSISFSLVDLNELKRLPFCTDGVNCFVSFTQDLVHDMVGLSVVEVSLNAALPPGTFVADATGPELVEYSLIDFNQELIVLQFSETLNVQTLNLSTIALQSLFANPISTYQLTGGSTPQANTSILQISLDQLDLDALKLQSQLCNYRGNCYISFTADLVEDMNSNDVLAVDNAFPGYLVVNYTRDTIPPSLIAFDLNLAVGTLTLEFSEPIDVDSIQYPDIVLQGVEDTNAPNITDIVSFPLSEPESVATLTTRSILVQLSATDVEALKASRYFVDEDTTFISLSSTALTDVAFYPNFVVEISSENATQVRNFTADRDGPILFSFTLDYNTNQLILMFNEPVLPSFNFTGISFSNVPMPLPGDDIYTLTGGTIANFAGEFEGLMDVVINLNELDATALKSSLTLAKDTQNTFISLANETVFNTFDEPNVLIVGLNATDVVRDQTDLMVVSYSLDLDTGLLLLSFNDVVRNSTFDPKGVIIQNASFSEDGARFELTENSINLSPSGFSLTIQIGDDDLNQIKANSMLATNENNTYLTIRASTVEDVFGDDILAVTNGQGIPVAVYTEDTTPPSLTNYTLDLNTGTLDLTFSEAVRFDALMVDDLLLQDSAITSNFTVIEDFISLNESSTTQVLSLTEVRVTLTLSDLNLIKQLPGLATDESNTFLSIAPGAIEDFAGNEINDSEVFGVGVFVADTTNPVLMSYTVSFTSGLLTLSFSETVNGSTLDVTKIIFQSSQIFRIGERFTLMTSLAEPINSPIIVVNISLNDLNGLKQLANLAVDNSSTFLVLRENAVSDTSGNPVVPISDIAAIPPANYTSDIIRPELLRFGLNLTTDILTLFFSETVSVASLDVTHITLHSSPSGNDSITLSGAYTESVDGPIVELVLPTTELNVIKMNENFATDQSNLYLSLTEATIRDTSSNPVMAIPPIAPLAIDATAFFADEMSPMLVTFEFDANQGLLTLSFSETVRVSTFNATGIVFQNATANYVEYRLTDA